MRAFVMSLATWLIGSFLAYSMRLLMVFSIWRPLLAELRKQISLSADHKLASSFESGIICEPLAGVRAICPVEPDTLLWLTSRCQLITSLLHAYELPAAAWSTERSLNLPGIYSQGPDMVEVVDERHLENRIRMRSNGT